MPILSGLIVSVDAFFIGLSLGLQKSCKFLYLAIINVFLLCLCILGYLIAGQIYERITFDTDIVVGAAFIVLGCWYIFHYFLSRQAASVRQIIPVGMVMSLEAMIITMGITFIFLPNSSWVIPITVALAHFGYSAISFFLARTNTVKRVPSYISHIVSGLALVAYGVMALLVDFGV